MIRISERLKKSKSLETVSAPDNSLNILFEGWVKRAFDFTAALIGLILLSPFFLIIAILIKRDSPGPVFYWGARTGRRGATFKMLKFRTMYETPKSYSGLRVTAQEDERITPLGKWLRDTKLNEFPQLWNILIGEMSLVGPRPEDPTISKTWPQKSAKEILSVRPGLTSPASILYRDEESMLHAGEVMQKYLHELSPNKMRLDQLYVQYRSFWLDLDVILWTALLLIPKIKAYSPPERLLFVGPVSRLIQRYVSWFIWDFLIMFASMGLITTIVRFFGPLDLSFLRLVEMALGFAMLNTVGGILVNANGINWPKATFWESGRLWMCWSIATIITLMFHYYFGIYSLRFYGVILSSSLLFLFGMIAFRYRERLMSGMMSRLMNYRLAANKLRERVLIVGSGRTAEHIAWLMDHPTYSGKFRIVGFIDDDLRASEMKIYGSKVIGRVEDIHAIVKKENIGLIILADCGVNSHKYTEFHDIASFHPARIVVAPDLFGSLSSLDSDSTITDSKANLNNFQCQYCLARFNQSPGSDQ